MSLIAAAISAAVAIGSAIYNSVQANKARKAQNKIIASETADNKAWYNSNAYSDYTQRADSQNLMKNLRENLKRSNKANANMAVVTGATPEARALQQEQANKVIADTYGNLGAYGQQWKDKVTDQYMNRKSSLASQQFGMYGSDISNYSTGANNAINQMYGIGGSLASSLQNGSSGTTTSGNVSTIQQV